ncbi:MAG: adenylate/guanylate cyclase domain-containing protein [Burkholderiales bacterium]|nr:adenylate/guanylate cyclase domain-containing protein [Burkholderiales bacterium]
MTQRTRRLVGQFALGVILVLVLALHLLGMPRLRPVERLDAGLYDLKLLLMQPRTVDERVVVVDIDERSLREVGRWPWPRVQTAALTRALYEQYAAAAIGFDVLFAEPDESSGLPVLERLARSALAQEQGFADALARLRPKLDYDAQLAAALGLGPSVLGYYFNHPPERERIGRLPAPVIDCARLAAAGVRPPRLTGYHANLPVLQERAAAAGFFNADPDFDGVVRRVPVLLDLDGRCYGSLALMTAIAALGIETVEVAPARGLAPARLLLKAPGMDALSLPLDPQGRALVPYRPLRAYRYVSAADVLKGVAPAAELEGRIVLIGSSAPGIMDLRVTPVAEAYPGVEIHANLISGLLDARLPWEAHGVRAHEWLVFALIGLALAALLPLLAPLPAALLAFALVVGVLAADLYAWAAWQLHWPVAPWLGLILGLFALNMVYGFFVEARAKAQITRLFGQYVPPELVDEMARDPARYSLRGESRVMSVLFSDIRDFTSISERLEAAQLADMLNVYLSHMTRIVQANRGTIDKYIGDAIMAFWGAPVPDERHAQHAVLTALGMQSSLAELNQRLKAQGWPEVRIGVGVNSGRMSVGNMGSQFRMAYTVMGDAVNLASRLEGLTKQYGVGILVGEDTRAACPDLVFMRVDRVRVKGKAQPVAIYEPLGERARVDGERLAAAESFEAALEAYAQQRWDEAQARIEALRQQEDRPLYALYLERIAHFRAHPPPADWDGVYTFTSK